MTPTNISTATEVVTTQPDRPTLFVPIWPTFGDGGEEPLYQTLAYPQISPADCFDHCPEHARIFAIPSTAAAERAKERERLISLVATEIRAYDGNEQKLALDVLEAARALAAFEAKIGGGV